MVKQGEGLSTGTLMGPLIHERAVEKARSHVNDAIKKGAKIYYGPSDVPPLGPKDPFFYPTTVMTGVTGEMDLAHEEV